MKKLVIFALLALAVAGCSSNGAVGDGGGAAGDAQAQDAGQIADTGTGDVGGVDAGETFPPESQAPFFEKGLVVPPNSIPCKQDGTGAETYTCNHHGSTIAELPDGSVAIVWYQGFGEKSLDSRIIWSRLAPGAAEWPAPVTLYDDPARAEGNPAIWVGNDGVLFCFFVTVFGSTWDEAYIRMVTSSDGGETWSDPVNLRAQYTWMARHRPLRLSDGRLILPLYNETSALPVFIYSSDEFATWQEQQLPDLGAYLADHAGQIQPALIQRADGTVVAITRDGTSVHRIHTMTSTNNGRNWTKSVPTPLPNSGTSVDWAKLLDGHVAVAYNNSPVDRFPLSVAVSDDEGETFAHNRDINSECAAPGTCSYHYPSIMQSRRDGTIWISYTHNRETIGWIHTNEAWLRLQTDPINRGQ